MTQQLVNRFDFSPFQRFTVGFDEIFDALTRGHEQLANNNVNYPPYNIIKHDTHKFALEVAVAGFELDEIDVEVEGNNLIIAGQKLEKHDEVVYIYKGISTRSFKRVIPLGEHIVVKEAVIKNGMLSIRLEREVPEAMRPRKIAITAQK